MRTGPERCAPNSAIPTAGSPLPVALEDLARRAEAYFKDARAPNTIKAYGYDLGHFAAWCEVEAGGLLPFLGSRHHSGNFVR